MRASIPDLLRPLLRQVLIRPSVRTFLITATIFVLTLLYCKHALWRDPHSAFFKDDHAYDLVYSKYRTEEAIEFIQSMNTTQSRSASDIQDGNAHRMPVVCAAFVTVRRDQQYFPEAVGSMLAGLHPMERMALNVSTLFADTDPTAHPNWEDSWVRNVIDDVHTYSGLTATQWTEVKKVEEEKNYYVKGVFDHIYVLSRCLQNTTAPFIAIFEDDIIFAEGWMTRTLLALQELKKHHSTLAGENLGIPMPSRSPVRNRATAKSSQSWLYLRLFYTETALMWEVNHDYWYSHLWLALVVTSSFVAAILFTIRHFLPNRSRPFLTTGTVLVLALVTTPALTILAFMVGKYRIWVPLQNPESPFAILGSIGGTAGAGPVSFLSSSLRRAGVVHMNKYGCCTQAMIFPRSQVRGLIRYLQERHDGQTDVLIEEYADRENYNRFALTPQVVQHVGLVSSRGNTLTNAQSTWAFWFEANDPVRLQEMHHTGIKKVDWDALRKAE